MVYPVVGTIIDHAGFIPTFRAITLVGFGAIAVVLLTWGKVDRLTGK